MPGETTVSASPSFGYRLRSTHEALFAALGIGFRQNCIPARAISATNRSTPS
jgi:hypothetical protein